MLTTLVISAISIKSVRERFMFVLIFRIRKRGAKFLHTKAVLLLVVLLNALDCVLVLTELVLDVSFVRCKISLSSITNFVRKS